MNPYARAARAGVALPAVFVGLFVAIPTVVTLRRGFDVSHAITDPGLRGVVWFTFRQAAISAVITTVVGVPIAWLLSRREFAGRRVLRALTLVPFVLPTVVVGLAFRTVFPGSLRSGVVPLVAAHVFLNVAVVVRIVGARWESQPFTYEDAAATLGAGPLARFRTVTLPMLRGAIVAASGLVFMYCFTTFGAARVLAGPTHPTTETEIYRLAVLAGDMKSASALAVAQIVLVGIVLALSARGPAHHVVPTRPRHISSMGPGSRRTLLACAAVVGCTFVLPLGGLVARSLRVGDRTSLHGWTAAFSDDPASADLVHAVGASVRVAAVAMIIATAIGFVLAFVRVHARSAGTTSVAIVCEVAPVVVSAVVVGLGFILAFRDEPFDWRGSWWLLPVAHSVVALPLVTRSIVPAMRQIPDDLRNAAASLGASPVRAFLDVDLRLLARPVGAAASLAALVSLGEFGASSLLTRRGSETLTMTIGRLLGRPGDLVQTQVFVAATVLGIVCLLVVWLMDVTADLRNGGRR